ncbi:MAG: hypothetical protein ACC608_02460 [Anaerofustis sp.]
MNISEYKNNYTKTITDEEMVHLLTLLSESLDKAIIVYSVRDVIIGGAHVRELVGHYISCVGHAHARVFLAGDCTAGNDPAVIRPVDLVFYLSDIAHLQDHGKWVVSNLIDTKDIPFGVLASEPAEFDF